MEEENKEERGSSGRVEGGVNLECVPSCKEMINFYGRNHFTNGWETEKTETFYFFWSRSVIRFPK